MIVRKYEIHGGACAYVCMLQHFCHKIEEYHEFFQRMIATHCLIKIHKHTNTQIHTHTTTMKNEIGGKTKNE